MRRPMISSFALALSLATLAACGGTPASSTTPTGDEAGKADGPSGDTALAACTAMMTRARTCDGYLPALVDMRIELDQPAGIAAQAAEAGGRDKLIAEAQTEWATDSTDENIGVACTQLAAGVDDAMVAEAERCNSLASCDEFVPCTVALMRTVHGGK